MQNTFSQSGNDSKWFSKKSFFRIGMWNSRPPPFMEKTILNFHFDYLHPSLIWIKGAQIGSNMPSALGLVTRPTAVLKKVSNSTLEVPPHPPLRQFQKRGWFFLGFLLFTKPALLPFFSDRTVPFKVHLITCTHTLKAGLSGLSHLYFVFCVLFIIFRVCVFCNLYSYSVLCILCFVFYILCFVFCAFILYLIFHVLYSVMVLSNIFCK